MTGSHRATTGAVQSLYPFMAGPGLGAEATYIGQDVYGGAFCHDPWALYEQKTLTNPNMLIAGELGTGKSALVKTMLWRGSVFGRRAAVLDPKGEYGPLCDAYGVEPIRLHPGGSVRLNPLDPGPGAADVGPDETARRQLTLLQSIASAALRRDLTPIERTACRMALARCSIGNSIPTLPEVAEALLAPSDADASEIHTSATDLARASHDVALELRRLCDGDLRGMFDGRSTVDVDWDGPLVVIDLSEFADDEGIPILMACATAWLNAAVVRPGAGRRFIVLDEAWRLLSHLGTARWLRASLKLARQYGVSNVLVMHRLTDLLAAGDANSEQVALARGLLSDTQTRVIYGQPRDAIDATADLLGLSRHEADEIANLGRGVGLWKVGKTSHLVVHHIGEREWPIIDTDTGMRADGPSPKLAG